MRSGTREFKKLTRGEPLSRRAYRALRQAIFYRELKDGERVTEVELAQALGLSRTPVHEAVVRLETEGLVEIDSGGLIITFSDQDVREVFDLRTLLEGYAARLAAERITPEEIAQLEELQKRLEALPLSEPAARAEVNEVFHWTIVTASRHGQLIRLLDGLREYLPSQHLMAKQDERITTSSMQHHDIIEALRERDSDRVAHVVAEHLALARELVVANPEERET